MNSMGDVPTLASPFSLAGKGEATAVAARMAATVAAVNLIFGGLIGVA